MTETVDYRSQITLSQAGCNTWFGVCDYKGQRKTFFMMTLNGHTSISVVSKMRTVDEKTLALTLPSFYENWKEYLVPNHLSYYKMTEQELVNRNGGKEIHNVQ